MSRKKSRKKFRRRTWKKIDKTELDYILRLHNQGWTHGQIAKKVNRSFSTVQRVIAFPEKYGHLDAPTTDATTTTVPPLTSANGRLPDLGRLPDSFRNYANRRRELNRLTIPAWLKDAGEEHLNSLLVDLENDLG